MDRAYRATTQSLSWAVLLCISIVSAGAQAVTTTAVSTSGTQAFTNAPGNALTYTAIVTSANSPVTEGEVQFLDNGTPVGPSVSAAGGYAQYQEIFSSATQEGVHNISAMYTDGASNPIYQSSDNSAAPAQVFIDNHTIVSSDNSTFCNPGPISIAGTPGGSAKAAPYPQHVYVTGLNGALANVTLQLNNVTANNGLGQWKVLLVAPDGAAFVPLAFAGGANSLSGMQLQLSDYGTAYLDVASANTSPSPGMLLLPSDYSSYLFPLPAPQSGYWLPYSVGNATFDSTYASENLNAAELAQQQWSLYIADENGNGDTLANGYCLTFVTNNNSATTTTLTTNTNPILVGNAITLTARVTVTSGGAGVSGGTVKFMLQNNSAPLGSATTDGAGNASFTFTPTVEGLYTFAAEYEGVQGQYNGSSGTISVQVDDPTQQNGTSYCNVGTISLLANGLQPQQYPSRVLVSGLAGVVSGVTVSVDGVSYDAPHDLAMQLADPAGDNLVFWANAGTLGQGSSINSQDFTFSDTGSFSLPSAANGPLIGGTYLPSAYNDVPVTFGSPAPADPTFAAPAGTASFGSSFNAANPNGYWSFYITRDAAGSSGSVGPRCLNLTVTPPALSVSVTESTPAFTQGDIGDTFSIRITNTGPGSTAGTLTLADVLPIGLIATAMVQTSGRSLLDWSCDLLALTCTRSSPMAAAEQDVITVTVNIASSAGSSLTNAVNVSGGGIATSLQSSNTFAVSFAPITVTVGTNVNGPTIQIDGGAPFTGSQQFTWRQGDSHTLTATTAQDIGGQQYTFTGWSDGGALSHQVIVSANALTYTAAFALTYSSVDSSVAINTTGLLYNLVDQGGTVVFAITNNSSQTLAGPLQLTFALPPGVTPVNNTGVFQGNPYWTVTTSLLPNTSATIDVQLSYLTAAIVQSTNPVVLVGSF